EVDDRACRRTLPLGHELPLLGVFGNLLIVDGVGLVTVDAHTLVGFGNVEFRDLDGLRLCGRRAGQDDPGLAPQDDAEKPGLIHGFSFECSRRRLGHRPAGYGRVNADPCRAREIRVTFAAISMRFDAERRLPYPWLG